MIYWSTLTNQQRIQLLSEVCWPYVTGQRFPTQFSYAVYKSAI